MNQSPERRLANLVRENFAQQDAAQSRVPGFRMTLDAAAVRILSRQPQRRRHAWAYGGAMAMLAALVVLLVSNGRTPTLDEDLALARTVSYEAIWHSPSDRLTANTDSALLRELPAMPQAGEPQLAKEYL
jgi:hypothetical protein